MTRARTHGTLLFLLMLAFAGAPPLDAASSYSVSGVVVDSRSHAPLANARVSLAPSAARDRKQEQVTKPDGRFSFAVSEPGKYALAMVRPGYPAQEYKQAGFASVVSAIVVRDNQDTRNLVFEANPGSVLAGLVKDEDSEPVSNALVTIFQFAVVDGDRKIVLRGSTRANDAGEFRFSNLPKGNYYICAMGRPWFADSLIRVENRQRVIGQSQPGQPAPKFSPDPGFRGTAFPTTFYPNARSVEQASLVRLEAGGETQVSIALPFTTAVSVKGTMNVPGEMSAGRANLYKKVHDIYVVFLEGWVGKDGTFEYKNVPPGSYEIAASSGAGSGAASWIIHQEVEVGPSDTEVTLRPQQMGSLSGRVLFEGERPAPTADLFVSLRNEKGSLYRAEVSRDGSFSLSRLPAGRYEVVAGNADYIAAYFTGPGGERLPPTLTISSGEPLRRNVTLTRAVSTIEGTAEEAGVPQVGAFVLLIPKNPSDRWAYRVDQTDSDGFYGLHTIPAGDYFAIALSNGEDVVYRDAKVAAALSKAAKPVHVDPGERLDLKLEVVSAATLDLAPL